jgi:hypothetical protein
MMFSSSNLAKTEMENRVLPKSSYFWSSNLHESRTIKLDLYEKTGCFYPKMLLFKYSLEMDPERPIEMDKTT